MTAATFPGRVRLVVDNDQATDQHGLIWGFRSRNYGTASTEALAYEAEALTRLDAGTLVAHSGASGGTVLQHPSLPGGAWCPVMATNIGGSAFMTHRGSYRVWGRCYSGTATPQLRFLWDVGDLSGPVTNDAVKLPGAANFYLMDFGEIRLDPTPVGPHRWEGVVQAKAAVQGDQVEIDRLWFQPLDEAAGKLVAVQQDSALGISVVQPAGAGADDATVGSFAWNQPGNITMAGDIPVATFGNQGASHYLKASSFGFAIPTGATISGIKVDILRYATYSTVDTYVRLVKAGTVQTPNKADTVTPWPVGYSSMAYKSYGGQSDLWSGTWTPADINNAGFGVALAVTNSVTVGPAGVDFIRITVSYTTSGGFSTAADAVIFASRTAELRTEGMYRQEPGGTAYGPVSQVVGDLPRIPPSGLEARTVQVFVKASRGNLSTEPDAGIDDISARITMRPSFLFVS